MHLASTNLTVLYAFFVCLGLRKTLMQAQVIDYTYVYILDGIAQYNTCAYNCIHAYYYEIIVLLASLIIYACLNNYCIYNGLTSGMCNNNIQQLKVEIGYRKEGTQACHNISGVSEAVSQ